MTASENRDERLVPRFNLVHDPWVRVRLTSGELVELSLREVFSRLDEVSSLAGETSVQDAAMLRLLIAIAHSALGPSTQREHDTAYEDAVEEWSTLWRDRARLRDAVVGYLDDWHERFELFDDERPFYQVARLTTGKSELGPLVRFVLDVPNDEDKQYFTMRAGNGLASLSFAEAARWLVTTQAFDTSGIKSGVQGDPRTKGGKGYPIGPAWAAQLGIVFLEGDDLAETLLLNLVRGKPQSGEWHDDDTVAERDIAPWEREGEEAIVVGVRPGTHDDLARVEGVVDALTWQSRRLLLQHDGARVIGVIIGNGDRAETTDRFAVEFMTPWRQPLSGVNSKTAPTILRPRRHDAEHAFWRGLPGILPALTPPVDGRGRALRAPGVLDWNAYLQARGVLARGKRYRVHALGLKLDANNAIIQDVYDDHLDLRAALVATDDDARRLAQAVETEAERTDRAVYALGSYARNLALAAGNRDSKVIGRALERGYFAVDAPFRRWVAEIGAEMDLLALDAHRAKWRQQAYALIRRLGDEIADEVGDAAIVGRPALGGRHMDASLADAFFRGALAKALPVAVAAGIEQDSDEDKKGTDDDDDVDE